VNIDANDSGIAYHQRNCVIISQEITAMAMRAQQTDTLVPARTERKEKKITRPLNADAIYTAAAETREKGTVAMTDVLRKRGINI
jgi:hypothetical protein